MICTFVCFCEMAAVTCIKCTFETSYMYEVTGIMFTGACCRLAVTYLFPKKQNKNTKNTKVQAETKVSG